MTIIANDGDRARDLSRDLLAARTRRERIKKEKKRNTETERQSERAREREGGEREKEREDAINIAGPAFELARLRARRSVVLSLSPCRSRPLPLSRTYTRATPGPPPPLFAAGVALVAAVPSLSVAPRARFVAG